jgi:hypothetical protein
MRLVFICGRSEKKHTELRREEITLARQFLVQIGKYLAPALFPHFRATGALKERSLVRTNQVGSFVCVKKLKRDQRN